MGCRVIPGPDNTVGALTLQTAYNAGPAIITGAGGAVELSRVLTDGASVLALDKSPAGSAAGSALAITMGLQSTAPAINVDNLGSEIVINSTAAFGISVGSVEAARFNANLDTQLAGSLFLKERATEAADLANYGQIWAKTDQSLWFTDSAGADRQIDLGSNLASIGASTYTSMQDARDTAGSTGVITGGEITNDTDGTITVAGGTGLIRATNDPTDTIYNFDWSAEDGVLVDLVDVSMNYVYVEYNAGSPRVIATTVKSADKQTNVLLATIYRDSTVLHISASNHRHINDHLCLMIDRLTQTEPFERGSGGVISETGTRNFAITAGVWWQGADTFSTGAFDSSGVDTFIYVYRDGGGGWTAVPGSQDINNLQYDDGTGALATLGNSRFGVHWEYIGQDGDVYAVYGRDSYTLEDAQNSQAPSDLPPWFAENHARIVGRIIIAKSAASFQVIESPFTSVFTGSAASDHGSLVGLGDDDHAGYLLTDGTRLVGGPMAWDSGGTSDPNIRASTVDPSAGGGVAAPEGSILMRFVSTAGEVWLKDGAAATAWTQVGTGGGGTLDAAYDFGGAGAGRAIIADSGAVTLTTDGVGVAETSAFELINSTVAAAGAQQFGPAFVQQGSGWKTDATSGPQVVQFAQQVETIQGTANPTGALAFRSNIAAAGYVENARLASSGQWLMPDGSAGGPPYSAASRPNTGVYFSATAGGSTNISANGTASATFTSSGIRTRNGSASSPSLVSTSDTNTGPFWINPDIFGISTGTTEAVRWTELQVQINSGHIEVPQGTTLEPSIGSDTYNGCGTNYKTNGGISWTALGAERLILGNNGLHLSFSGTGSVSALGKISDPNTGLNWPSADTLYAQTDGTERQRWSANTTGLPVSTIKRLAIAAESAGDDLDVVGLALVNTTAALVGSQAQHSPALLWQGEAWDGSASQTVRWYAQLVDAGGGESNYNSRWTLAARDSTGWNDVLVVDSPQLHGNSNAGARWGAHVLPDTDSTYSLGTTGRRWSAFFTDSIACGGAIEIDGDLNHDGSNVGFYGSTPVAKPAITGSRAGNAALADLLTELATMGLLTDNSTA